MLFVYKLKTCEYVVSPPQLSFILLFLLYGVIFAPSRFDTYIFNFSLPVASSSSSLDSPMMSFLESVSKSGSVC
jgi:hypothetical protein